MKIQIAMLIKSLWETFDNAKVWKNTDHDEIKVAPLDEHLALVKDERGTLNAYALVSNIDAPAQFYLMYGPTQFLAPVLSPSQRDAVSPLPWNEAENGEIRDANGDLVATTEDCRDESWKNESNARYIARAANLLDSSEWRRKKLNENRRKEHPSAVQEVLEKIDKLITELDADRFEPVFIRSQLFSLSCMMDELRRAIEDDKQSAVQEAKDEAWRIQNDY